MDKKSKTSVQLSSQKLWGFRILMALVPVLLLVLLEVGLRVGNYGGELDLFIPDTSGHDGELVLNQNFLRRYFFKPGMKLPTPHTQRFSETKSDSTYRIFCLGASTTQGMPYTHNAGFPAQLSNILTSLHSDTQFEVINCGITAISSLSVLDMTREVVENYEPDLIVVYSGHNEFYGVFGQASNLSLFSSQSMTRLLLQMQKSRLVLLTRNIMVSMFGERITEDSVIDHATLMGSIAKNAAIPLNDPRFEATLESYRSNLNEIVSVARSADTDIILCTLVDNLSDQPPLAFTSGTLKPSDAFGEVEERASGLKEQENYRDAVSAWQKYLTADEENALAHYKLAQCYEALNMHNLAHEHFRQARDLDQIRFRASSHFNDVITDITSQEDVPLADVQASLAFQSPHGITGSELLTEHVHPNDAGYFYIAKSIATTMSKNGFVNPKWDWSAALNDSVYLKMTALTDLGHEVANYSIHRLKLHWPFSSDSVAMTSYERVGSEATEAMAIEIVEGGVSASLTKKHIDLGYQFYQGNRLDDAMAEYEASLAIQPTAEVYNRIGLVHSRRSEYAYRKFNNYDAARLYFELAENAYKTGLAMNPGSESTRFNLGLLYSLRKDRYADALLNFQKVLDTNPAHKNAMKQVVQMHLRRKEFDAAARRLQGAVEMHPDEADFAMHLGYVYAVHKNYPDALQWLNRALEIRPDHRHTNFLIDQVEAKLSGTESHTVPAIN